MKQYDTHFFYYFILVFVVCILLLCHHLLLCALWGALFYRRNDVHVQERFGASGRHGLLRPVRRGELRHQPVHISLLQHFAKMLE